MDRRPRNLAQALRLLRETTWPETRWKRADFLLTVLLETRAAHDEDRFAGAERDLLHLFGRRRVQRRANLPGEERPIDGTTLDLVDRVSHSLDPDDGSEDGADDGARS